MQRLLLSFSLGLLCACQTSYLVARGDAALERGEPEVALADYQAALGRRVVAGQKREVEKKRDRAALRFARQEIQRANERAAEGAGDEARLVLSALLAADLFGAHEAKEEVVAALEALDAGAWQEVERLAKGGRFVPAVRSAEQLAAPYPVGHAAHREVAQLRRRAQTHHDALAAGKTGAARLFHLRMAAALGAQPSPEAQTLEQTLDAKTSYRIEARVDEERCPRFARVLRERMIRRGQTGTSTLALTVERCSEMERLWTERSSKTYRDRLPKPGFEERSYWVEDADPACAEPAGCLRYDRLGVCVEPAERCEESERRLAVKQVPVVEYEEVERELDVAIRHRKAEVSLAGIVALDGRPSVPFEVRKSAEDEEYWFPGGQRIFGSTDLSHVLAQAYEELSREVDRHVAEIRAEEAVAAAERAGREGEYVAAIRLGRVVPEPAAAHFSARYGLTKEDALRVMFGGGLFEKVKAPAPVKLVQPERDPELDALEYAAVAQTEPAGGLEALAKPGIDLSANVAMSPLSTASRIHGIAARFRFTRLHVGLAGQSALLGGDAGGFGVSMTGVSLDLEEEGFFFGFGLSYEQQRSDAGERYASFSIPLLVRVPVASWLWFGARFDPNLLYAKTIFDDDEEDPHFYSPISVWGVVDFEHVFLRLGAAHYLGAGFGDEVVQLEGALGVRL